MWMTGAGQDELCKAPMSKHVPRPFKPKALEYGGTHSCHHGVHVGPGGVLGHLLCGMAARGRQDHMAFEQACEEAACRLHACLWSASYERARRAGQGMGACRHIRLPPAPRRQGRPPPGPSSRAWERRPFPRAPACARKRGGTRALAAGWQRSSDVTGKGRLSSSKSAPAQHCLAQAVKQGAHQL